MPVKLRTTILALLIGMTTAVVLAEVPARDARPARATAQDTSIPASKPEPPAQPVPFSHRRHSALGMQCQTCHANPEPGDRMTFPAAAQCMACHTTIAKDKPPIQKLAKFAKSKQAIPWARLYVVASWVYWNHRTHLEAKMTCEVCHGRVEEMEVMKRVSDVATMAGCIDCHRRNDVTNGCRSCHADK